MNYYLFIGIRLFIDRLCVQHAHSPPAFSYSGNSFGCGSTNNGNLLSGSLRVHPVSVSFVSNLLVGQPDILPPKAFGGRLVVLVDF